MTLKNKVINGLKWSILAKFAVQVFSWVSTFLIIRILSPEDYGIVAIASLVFDLVSIFALNGFISALVKTQNINVKSASQVFTFSLSVYILFSLLLAFFASHIASFYNNEFVENALYFMAVITPLNSLRIVPNAILNVKMDFKTKALCEFVSSLATTLVALIGAYQGLGFWCLLYANAVGLVIRVIMLNYVASAKYGVTSDFIGAKKTFIFAGKIQLNGLVWFAYNKLDTLIVGKFLGLVQLGIYQVAVDVASTPMSKVSTIINQVGFSAFSSLEENMSACQYYLQKAFRLVSLAIFPIFVGISNISLEVCTLILGEKWLAAAPIISIIALVFPFRMLNIVLGSFLNAIDQAGSSLINTSIISVILISSILIGVQFGLKGTAMGWLFGFVFAINIIFLRMHYKHKIELSTLYCWIWPAMPSAIMWFGLNYLSRIAISADISLLALLAIKVVCGGVFIAITYLLFFSKDIKVLLKKT